MALTTSIRDSTSVGAHQKIGLLLLAGLLILRLPLLGGVGYLSETPPDWLDPTFQVGTYILTAILIWWERDRLADFHIDGLAIVIIILFMPIQTIILAAWGMQRLPLAFPNLLSLVLWVVPLALALGLLTSRPKLPRLRAASFGWLGTGILVGIVTAVASGYPMSLQINKSDLYGMPELSTLPLTWTIAFIYQIGYAAVSEEPLFRGFLWGYLRKFGWKDIWICLFQAGLFMLGHIYYVSRAPISFWILVPTSGLVLGLLAWRSRSIATSMAAHGTLNAIGYTIGYIIAFYRQ